MIGDSRPDSLAGAESSGAADLVTAALTGPIYQLICGVMHYQPGSRGPGQNIAKAWNSRWKGAIRQVCEQHGEGFRECDVEHTNLTVSCTRHIKLSKDCKMGWSLAKDWYSLVHTTLRGLHWVMFEQKISLMLTCSKTCMLLEPHHIFHVLPL